MHFTRRNRYLKVGLANSNSIFSRGYNEQHLNKKIHSELNTSREACLQQKQNQDKSARIHLVVTYHPILPFFCATAKWPLLILHISERLWSAFWYPLLIAFCHPSNLKALLVKVTLTSTPSELPGNYPCRAFRCETCPILRAKDEFSSHYAQRERRGGDKFQA